MKRSVLALVNGQPWDLHRPLEEDCELQLLHFREADPSISNKVLSFKHQTVLSDSYHSEILFRDACRGHEGLFFYV